MIVSSVEDARLEAVELEKNKSSQIWAEVNRLRLNRIAGVYNKLAADDETHSFVISSLLNSIVQASEASISLQLPQLLRFALCRVVSHLLNVPQMEHFIREEFENPYMVSTGIRALLFCALL
jgi:hypothetical protein